MRLSYRVLGQCFTFLLSCAAWHAALAQEPRVFFIDAGKLEKTKQSIRAGDKTFAAAVDKLDSYKAMMSWLPPRVPADRGRLVS